MSKLDQLNKGSGTAVQLLRTKVSSMPRSNTTTTLETNEGSMRSWKQIRTRGLASTTQSLSQLQKSDTITGSVFQSAGSESDFGEDINIDLDLATEVQHSIMDILEALPSMKNDSKNWHRFFLQIIAELLISPTSSVCSLTRVMKILRGHSSLLLDEMIGEDLNCLKSKMKKRLNFYRDYKS